MAQDPRPGRCTKGSVGTTPHTPTQQKSSDQRHNATHTHSNRTRPSNTRRSGFQRRRLLTSDGNPLVFGRLLVIGGGAGWLVRLLFRRHTFLRVCFHTPAANVRRRGRRGVGVSDGDDDVNGCTGARDGGWRDTFEFHGSFGTVGLLRFGSILPLQFLRGVGKTLARARKKNG